MATDKIIVQTYKGVHVFSEDKGGVHTVINSHTDMHILYIAMHIN